MQRTLKPLMALAAALVMLFSSAAPSLATTGTVTAGTLSVNLVPPLTSSLVPGSGPCSGGSVLDATSTSASSATLTLNFGSTGSAFTYNGATYFLTGSASGTVTLSGGTLSGSLSVSGAQIKRETSPGSCVAGTVVCPSINVASLPVSGSFSGSFTPPAVSGTATGIGGTSSPISALGCAPPFSTLNGKIVTISGLDATF